MVQKNEHKTWIKIIMALYILKFLQQEPAHGNKMAEEIKRRTEHLLTPNCNSLYPLLRIMEERGYISGSWTDEEKRSKRIYAITEAGRQYIPALTEKVAQRLNEMERSINLFRKDLIQ